VYLRSTLSIQNIRLYSLYLFWVDWHERSIRFAFSAYQLQSPAGMVGGSFLYFVSQWRVGHVCKIVKNITRWIDEERYYLKCYPYLMSVFKVNTSRPCPYIYLRVRFFLPSWTFTNNENVHKLRIHDMFLIPDFQIYKIYIYTYACYCR